MLIIQSIHSGFGSSINKKIMHFYDSLPMH